MAQNDPNKLVQAAQSGLVNTDQLLQSLAARGSLTSNPDSTGDAVIPIAAPYLNLLEKTDPKSAMPRKIFNTKSFGETEGRVLSYSGDSMFSPKFLATSAMSKAQAELLESVRKEMRKEQLLPTFSIGHDWFSVLDKHLGTVDDNQIVLPFPKCIFKLDYVEGTPYGIISQHPETNVINVLSFSANPGMTFEEFKDPYEVFKRHVIFACVAMEMGLAGKMSEINADLGKDSVAGRDPVNSYKVLPIKLTKSQPKPHNVNTGASAQRFHVRRSHWKTVKGVRKRIKWYFAGNIELGFIIKDYAVV